MLDVAERAGVSKASVSRFIGDDRALLSDAIALRIEQAIDELGYRPNQMARGLKRGRTRLIGMLVADIRNPYSIAVMHGVETACRQHGYSLVVCNTDRDDEQERQHLAALRAYNIEGLIVNTLGHHLDQLLELQREMPLVLVDRKVEPLHSDLVGLDNPVAVRMAVEHLEQQGYRDLLLVTEATDGTSSRLERLDSFKAEMTNRPTLTGAVLELDGELEQRLQKFLGKSGPKALFCANGIAALACTRALKNLGCDLFDDVGLIALDDLDWYPLVGNGITALAQPTEAIGASAFDCLLKRLRGDSQPPRTLDFLSTTMHKYPVSISLSSYGADLVRQQGQLSFVEVLAAAGAQRIEWREELLTTEQPHELAQAAADQGLECVFSSPLELWVAGRSQPNAELAATLDRAQAFGARWLKVSLGYFTDTNDLDSLSALLNRHPVKLLVENDQTLHGGRIEPMQRFFNEIERLAVPVKMTFDIGNWQWQDQSATTAARLLGRHVDYLHCKAVARRADGKLVALPPGAADLHLWEQLLKHMTQGITRAVEFPLQGNDLVPVTAQQVATLAVLGQPRVENAHV
eukprot:gene2318-2627_t